MANRDSLKLWMRRTQSGKGRGVCQQMQISLIICDRHDILKKGEITVF